MLLNLGCRDGQLLIVEKKKTKYTKKGVPLYSNLVNLKSNTMKNTLQR